MDKTLNKEVEDLQDKLYLKYNEVFDRIYYSIKKVTGKEPSPSIIVRRFKDDYPELVRLIEEKT